MTEETKNQIGQLIQNEMQDIICEMIASEAFRKRIGRTRFPNNPYAENQDEYSPNPRIRFTPLSLFFDEETNICTAQPSKFEGNLGRRHKDPAHPHNRLSLANQELDGFSLDAKFSWQFDSKTAEPRVKRLTDIKLSYLKINGHEVPGFR